MRRTLMRRLVPIVAGFAVLAATTAASYAQDKLRVAVPQRGFWDSTWVEFGQIAGFFKEAGIDVEIFWTDGGAQTLTAAMSGSVDIALSNGTLGVLGAHFKKAPVRIISAQMTGANELYWWVRADSPYKSLKDVPEGRTVAFSSPGSSTNLVLLSLLNASGSKARPLATGGAPATYTQVMTGQVDVGWSVVPRGLAEADQGKLRIIARASEAKDMADQTIRVNVANAKALAERRPVIERFMQAYAKSIDWAYSNPKAIEIFAKNMKVTPEIAKRAVDEFYPKSAMQMGEIRGLDLSIKQGIEAMFLPAGASAKDLEGLIDIVYKPGAK